ncbi:MAG TPA: hypothetical protein VF668_23745 [Pyrinomonadaceae bacterium]|jgi:MFS family permease
MAARAANAPNAPKLFYALAALVGCCGLPLSFAVLSGEHGAERAAAGFLTLLLGGDGAGAWLAGAAVFAAPQGLLGALFGYAMPEAGWRWGVWLTAPPLCLLTFFVSAPGFFLPALALSTLPACAGAHAGGRLRRRRARVI